MVYKLKKAIQLIGIIVIGIFLVSTAVGFAQNSAERVRAEGPIPPPVGAPKLSLSTKVVTPTLANPVGEDLVYNIEILNTGAYQAVNVNLTDAIPANTTYNGDAHSSVNPQPVYANGVLSWVNGTVGFDDSVLITFSVSVASLYQGLITNTAVISAPLIPEPVTVTAETMVTDHPIFEIAKTATPELPGKNKPLTYELVVTNVGQDATDTPINVTDFIPANTTFLDATPGCVYDAQPDPVVSCDTNVSLPYGGTSVFTFSVQVGNVPSGTVIENNVYTVAGPDQIGVGAPYTTTVIDPILILSKTIDPDPPGSNREMTYTLTVLNVGSKATDLEITDDFPPELEYRRCGGSECSQSNGVVTWHLDSLDTRETAEVYFTVYVGDIANIIVLNEDYTVCSAEGVCSPGIPVPSLLVGPTFEVTAEVYPIAHKPGGGSETYVTPTLTIHNIGPGNALDANALLTFGNLSVENDVIVTPTVGTLVDLPSCDMGNKCLQYWWTGNVAVGDIITFTTLEGQSTVGGDEGTPYTATIVVTDTLGGYVTDPATATAVGHVTHYANLIPIKTAPTVIGAGQEMTYTIEVFNSGLSTEEPPYPTLTETVPSSVTLLGASDGGSWEIIGGETVITWDLPEMSVGESIYRYFNVLVDPDLVSGTLIINDDYRTTWYESELTGTLTNLGAPFTTTVREVGLIDSYKTVTPTWALPGEDIVLTYVIHVVNSGPNNLTGVELADIFPWEHTTYQRDAVATAGALISDIVSLDWTGNLAPYSEELITFTAVVDDFFEGVVTNTATISHDSLLEDKVVTAVAYITDDPVLRISKVATPDPVMAYSTLLYQIQVTNLGQQATYLVVTDTIPANTSYIFGSASSGGQVVDGVVTWNLPVLNPGQSILATFRVTVTGGNEIINDSYAVRCKEGVYAYGEPVITKVIYPTRQLLLPLILKY